MDPSVFKQWSNLCLQFSSQYSDTIQKWSFQPLRMIVAGTAGSGKGYLIKCPVRSIRELFQSNKAVQVQCPTRNSANLVSGVTLHSFLQLPIGPKCWKEISLLYVTHFKASVMGYCHYSLMNVPLWVVLSWMDGIYVSIWYKLWFSVTLHHGWPSSSCIPGEWHSATTSLWSPCIQYNTNNPLALHCIFAIGEISFAFRNCCLLCSHSSAKPFCVILSSKHWPWLF